MKVLFVSDFFREDLNGGAESNDRVLIDHLIKNGFEVEKIRSHNLTEEKVIKNNLFLISNFTSISERVKQILKLKKYIIYEHDHKYLRTRDPSVFPDFVAPPDQIINRDFYAKAHKVIVLSDICKRVMEKNLNITNVYNIGCSLWSTEKLNLIESLADRDKKDRYCIINSNNRIKGTREAVEYCKAKNIEYDLIGPLPETELLKTMTEYNYFIFLPQVLETLSRITVEAKMLNCKILTKANMIGACSEDWFALSGKELISEIKTKVEQALESFVKFLKDDEITVILNCYRRPEYLETQIKAIRCQTVKPKQIWIWVNHHKDNSEIDFSKFDVDRVIKNDYNWKFYGRFAAGMLADTKYIAMFDDDTIPGPQWFSNCLKTMDVTPGILGGVGVLLKEDRYYGHGRVGWSSHNNKIVEVDLVGHAWFFEREWLKYLWMETPFTWENGEDIQFSYTAQKHGNIKTFVPPHPSENEELHSSLYGYKMGVDDKATSNTRNHEAFYAQRDACVKNAVFNGWNPVYMRN